MEAFSCPTIVDIQIVMSHIFLINNKSNSSGRRSKGGAPPPLLDGALNLSHPKGSRRWTKFTLSGFFHPTPTNTTPDRGLHESFFPPRCVVATRFWGKMLRYRDLWGPLSVSVSANVSRYLLTSYITHQHIHRFHWRHAASILVSFYTHLF